MERRKALAVATAATLVLGGIVVGTASVSGASFLGFGGGRHGPGSFAASVVTTKQGVIVKRRDVYDRYVVDTGVPAAAAARAGAGARPAVAPATAATAPANPAPVHAPATMPATEHHEDSDHHEDSGRDHRTASPTTAPHLDETPEPTTAPTTAPPTAPPTSPTTAPREYHVPRNWPNDAPLPPFPSGSCHEPSLYWDGVNTNTAYWVCDD